MWRECPQNKKGGKGNGKGSSSSSGKGPGTFVTGETRVPGPPIPGIWFATATPIVTSSSSASSSVTRTFNPGQLPEWMLQVQAPRVDARAATNSLFSWSDLHSSSLTTPEEQTEWHSAEQFFVGSPRDASAGPSTISVSPFFQEVTADEPFNAAGDDDDRQQALITLVSRSSKGKGKGSHSAQRVQQRSANVQNLRLALQDINPVPTEPTPGNGFTSEASSLFPCWFLPDSSSNPEVRDSVYHSRTKIKGKESLLVDIGAVNNLVGGRWVERQSALAGQFGLPTTMETMHQPLHVQGVGNGSQSCTEVACVPIAIAQGGFGVERYKAPVVPNSDLPALLGLNTLESMGAIIDCSARKVIFPGPGGCVIQT